MDAGGAGGDEDGLTELFDEETDVMVTHCKFVSLSIE